MSFDYCVIAFGHCCMGCYWDVFQHTSQRSLILMCKILFICQRKPSRIPVKAGWSTHEVGHVIALKRTMQLYMFCRRVAHLMRGLTCCFASPFSCPLLDMVCTLLPIILTFTWENVDALAVMGYGLGLGMLLQLPVHIPLRPVLFHYLELDR